MRSISLAALLVVAAGCATLRVPLEEVSGPTLTVTNEAHSPLDLSYRCTENGPVQRLGAVNPGSQQTFVLRPVFCSTVYLIRQPIGMQPLGLERWGERALAIIPFFGRRSVEVVFASPGVILTRDPASEEEPEAQDET